LALVHLVGAGFALGAIATTFSYWRALRLALPNAWPWTLAGSVAAVILCLFAAWKAYRRNESPATCWRTLVYVVVGAWVADVFLWNTPHPMFDAWTVTAAAGLHAIVCLLTPCRSPARRRWLRVPDVVAMNVVVLLLLGEAWLRLLAAVWPSPLLIAPGSPVIDRIDAHHAVPGQRNFGFPHNSRGYYDQEFLPPADRTRPVVLCIGDSFSTALVPHAFHYTTVAEKAIGGVDVYNMGVSACGPREYLHLWKHEGESLRPDLLVVALFLGNDVSEGSFEERPVDWHDPQVSLLFRTIHRLRLLYHEKQKTSSGATFGDTTTEDARADVPDWVDDPSREHGTYSSEQFLRIETDRAAVICDGRPDPRFGRFTEVLQAIIDAAGRTPLVFMLIPDEFQVEDRLWDEVSARNSIPLERDRTQTRIRAWFAARDVRCLDLLPALRALPVEDDGWRHAYLRRDTHFNARGNRCAGEALAAFLRPQLEAIRHH
jgi:hypothetical protein